MARVTCAISGIRFDVSYLEGVSIPHKVGYYHPIFTLPHKQLYRLYSQHTRNQLSATDSYLLFCAFLYATEAVSFNSPASCNPNDARTIRLVQNNIQQLISVYERTSVIKHPRFKQPRFVVAYDNSQLDQVHNWIFAWEENLQEFNTKRADAITRRNLLQIEKFLEEKITSGTPIEHLPFIVSDWAAKAAEFPADKEESYKKVIRSCFNSTKMFNTPLALIKEVQEYCYTNIEPGSIHFHTLCETLKSGIAKHLDYLGGSSLALGYTLLPSSEEETAQLREGELKTQAELTAISNAAPLEAPDPATFPQTSEGKTAYLKAKLAYTVARTLQKTPPEEKPVETKKELDL